MAIYSSDVYLGSGRPTGSPYRGERWPSVGSDVHHNLKGFHRIKGLDLHADAE